MTFILPLDRVVEIHNLDPWMTEPDGYAFSWLGGSMQAVLLRKNFDPTATMHFRLAQSWPWTSVVDFTTWKEFVSKLMSSQPGCLYAQGPVVATPAWDNWKGPEFLSCHDNGWYKVEQRPLSATVYSLVGYLEARRDNHELEAFGVGSVVKEGWIFTTEVSLQSATYWSGRVFRVTPGDLGAGAPFAKLKATKTNSHPSWTTASSQLFYSDKAPIRLDETTPTSPAKPRSRR